MHNPFENLTAITNSDAFKKVISARMLPHMFYSRNIPTYPYTGSRIREFARIISLVAAEWRTVLVYEP